MKTCTCGFDMWTITTGDTNTNVCRRCDTAAQNNGMRVGPPTTPGSRNGWIPALFGDRK